MIVAVLALALTIYQAYLTRRHNRLTVRPLLDRAMNKARTPDGLTFSFMVRNSGIGPAVIRDAKAFLDRSVVSDLSEESVAKLLTECFGTPPNYQVRSTSLPGVNTALLPEQQICLAEIHFPASVWKNDEREIQKRFDRIDYLIRYESLYKERFVLATCLEVATVRRAGE